MKTLSPSKNVATWAAYNSLLSKKPTRTAAMITNDNPTNWDNLYTALKEADKLWGSVYCDGKTIVTLNLQFQEKVDIKVTLCFEWESSMQFSVFLK